MDGVLADFNEAVFRMGVPKRQEQSIHKSKDKWTKEDYELNDQVVKCMQAPGFWKNIPLVPDALNLWEFCKFYKPIILTAKPDNFECSLTVEQGKKEWVYTKLGLIPDNQFICCFRSEKKNFIGHTNHKLQILVDDMPQNCKEWEQAGGIGIIHTSAQDSISQLEKIING